MIPLKQPHVDEVYEVYHDQHLISMKSWKIGGSPESPLLRLLHEHDARSNRRCAVDVLKPSPCNTSAHGADSRLILQMGLPDAPGMAQVNRGAKIKSAQRLLSGVIAKKLTSGKSWLVNSMQKSDDDRALRAGILLLLPADGVEHQPMHGRDLVIHALEALALPDVTRLQIV